MKLIVDIDGVLADHITGFIDRVRAKYGLNVAYRDITEYDAVIGSIHLGMELLDFMKDRRFVLSLLPIRGAASAMQKLYRQHHLVVVTARPTVADLPTQVWLDWHNIPYHEYLNTTSAHTKRAALPGDILIDDYTRNVLEFSATGRLAILFDHPWNRNDPVVTQAINAGKVARARNWQQVLAIIRYKERA